MFQTVLQIIPLVILIVYVLINEVLISKKITAMSTEISEIRKDQLSIHRPITASPNMQKFFEKLLVIKKDLKDESNKTQDPFLLNLYARLHQTIKEKENV